ncbi:MAG TPA: hypothetical protein VG937_09430 [Polyangiaceae bacterium]|nr:hypothetical protein [Polyangiaceae bacterium]
MRARTSYVWRSLFGAVVLASACSVNDRVSFVPDEQFDHSGGRASGGMVGEGGAEDTGGAGSVDCAGDRDARCSIDGVLEVCQSGSWVRGEVCGAGLCSASRRTCLSCAPGSFSCEKGGPTLKQCNLDGSAWDVVRTCASAEACVAEGDVGYCKLCEPESVICSSGPREYPTSVALSGNHSRPSASLRACNAQGSGTEELDRCGLDAPVCDAVASQCRGCIPGQTMCEGGSLYLCTADGMGHRLVAECGHAALCDASAGACKRAGCSRASGGMSAVGSVACEKSALSICRASGKWEVLDICDGDEACSAGVEARLCLNASDHCLPGSSSCADDQVTLLRCADFSEASQSAREGGASFAYAHCSAGCSVDADGNAACEPVLGGDNDFSDELVCVPGSSSYLSCGPEGCLEAECAAGQICADSDLGCRSCVPNALRCEDNRLLRCDARGNGESLIEDCGSGVCDKIRGRCLPAAVGERYCDGGLLRGVGVDGSLQTIENCGAAELCDAQAGCKPAYCVLGSVSCQKGRVFSCEDGTRLTPTGHSCDSEDRCEEGLGCAVAARITAGDAHTCALIVSEDAAEGATGYVKCWGANESGQLGNGSSLLGDELQARPVVSRLSGDPGQVSAIFRGTGLCAGRNFSCADLTLPSGDAGVGCWGANDRGQLGIGGKVNAGQGAGQSAITYSNRIELPVMKASDATSGISGDVAFAGLHGVVCGADFACALDENDAAYCWGSNDAGQLGTGQASVAPNSLAMPVANLGSLKRLAAGGRHACGIDSKRRVYCWGDNSKDQLGQGDAVLTDSHAPIAVGMLHADELALGRDFTFALSESALVSWGQNTFGQLSTGNTSAQSTPSPALGLELASLSSLVSGPGAAHACAVVKSSLWCWGANPLAELGDGSRLDRYQPVLTIESDARHLPGAAGSIAIGKAHTCALDGDGNIWCWGANQRRQLGRASIAPAAPSPLRVY